MPARRPRILTVRLVAVALVVGVVLAVASVPVGAVVARRTLTPALAVGLAERWEAEGHLVYVMRYDYPFGVATWWESGSEPVSEALVLRFKFEHDGMRRASRDARPADVRTALDGQMRTAASYRVGFPFASARSLRRQTLESSTTIGAWRPTVRGREYTVPLLPHWQGLLANLMFYALLVLAPVVLWRWWRVRRRIKRGRCAACGYELGPTLERGVSTCPECGLAATGA